MDEAKKLINYVDDNKNTTTIPYTERPDLASKYQCLCCGLTGNHVRISRHIESRHKGTMPGFGEIVAAWPFMTAYFGESHA